MVRNNTKYVEKGKDKMRNNRRTAWSMIFLMLATSFPSEVNMENVYASTNYVQDNIEEQNQNADEEIEIDITTQGAVTSGVVTDGSTGVEEEDNMGVPDSTGMPITSTTSPTDSSMETLAPTNNPVSSPESSDVPTLPPLSNLTTPTPKVTSTPTVVPTIIPSTTTSANGAAAGTQKEETTKFCEVVYVLKGGKNHNLNPSKLADKNVSISLFAPKKSGYQFQGWYMEASYQNKVSEIANTGQDKIILYAKWKKVVVKKAKIVSAQTIASNKIKVEVKKIKLVKGYEYVYAFSPSFSKKYRVRTTKNPKVLHKLKGGKECYIMVRAYQMDSYGRKIYGIYSKVVKRKLKD